MNELIFLAEAAPEGGYTALDGTDALNSLWDNGAQLDRLAQIAVREALQEHKRKGQSVVVWQDGQIVTLTPDEIPEQPASEDARY